MLLLREFFTWWYLVAPHHISTFNLGFLKAIEHQLSFFLIIKTFFKPWRGEYREGLVGFAIFMSVLIKSFILFADVLILLSLATLLMAFSIGWLVWPFASVYLFLQLIS